MEKKKSTGLLLSILGVISLVLITAGVTYAFFSYTKEGVKENTITTGSITFRYDEGSTALVLSDALPMSDANGVTQTNGGNNQSNIQDKKFAFTITSTTPSTAKIPYVVTVRKDATSTIPESEAKIYLEVGDTANETGTSDEGILTGNSTSGVETYSSLLTTVSGADWSWYHEQATDKVIYKGVVPANQTSNYVKYFDLGMWLKLDSSSPSAMADYSAYEFVLKTAATGTYSSISSLSRSTTPKQILTSNEYYALSDNDKALYERIAYVNETAGYLMTVTQATTASATGSTATIKPESTEITLSKNEQYYPLNGKTFKVTVNVYAEGATVY